MRVAVTRPQPQASGTARKLIAAGHQLIVTPLLTFQPLPVPPLDPAAVDAVVFTSRSACEALVRAGCVAEPLHDKPGFAVGDATATAAADAGFKRVTSADGDAAALVRLLAARLGRGTHVLQFCGDHQAADLEGPLAAHGIALTRQIVYRMAPVIALPEPLAVAAASGALEALLFYSPRTASIYVDLLREHWALPQLVRLLHCAISRNAAAPLKNAGIVRILVSPHPSEDAMLSAMSDSAGDSFAGG